MSQPIDVTMKCAGAPCRHVYKLTREKGRRFTVHRSRTRNHPDRYAIELADTVLWVCDNDCESNVQWIGAWNQKSLVFKRTNVRGDGDCLFEASSNPGVRTVTRTSVVNWLTEQHLTYFQAKEEDLPLSLRLLAEEMLNLVKEYLMAPEYLQEDIDTSKLEAKWYADLMNDERTWCEVDECLKQMNELVRGS